LLHTHNLKIKPNTILQFTVHSSPTNGPMVSTKRLAYSKSSSVRCRLWGNTAKSFVSACAECWLGNRSRCSNDISSRSNFTSFRKDSNSSTVPLAPSVLFIWGEVCLEGPAGNDFDRQNLYASKQNQQPASTIVDGFELVAKWVRIQSACFTIHPNLGATPSSSGFGFCRSILSIVFIPSEL
jgi:hypothetical protein